MMYPTIGRRASPNSSIKRKMLVLIPSSQVTARVNGGRLNVIGSPVRRKEFPFPSNSTRTAGAWVPHVSPNLRNMGLLTDSNSPFRHRHNGQTPMPRPVDRPHCEDDVILRKLERRAPRVPCVLRVLPFRTGG